MEKLQGPIKPYEFFEEELEKMSYDEFISLHSPFTEIRDHYLHYTIPNLEEKMPFLHMLQGVESQQVQESVAPFFPLEQESSLQLLLMRLEHQKQMMKSLVNDQNQGFISNDTVDKEMQSSVKFETQRTYSPIPFDTFSSKGNQQVQVRVQVQEAVLGRSKRSRLRGSEGSNKERRKRKSMPRLCKNKEELESQRMTHIAVERNRRRQMNDHLNALRSLMPTSYIQRGDQASIIGGAIDFVKDLEQLLHSLQAQKRMSEPEGNRDVSASPSTSSSSNLVGNQLIAPSPSTPLQFWYPLSHSSEETEYWKGNEEFSAGNSSGLADIQVVVIQNHVNLKFQCQRRPGQLLKTILAFQQLRVSVLHLNISSLHSVVHYSFNLKIEDECKLRSADDVTRAVHQIFSLFQVG